MAGVSEAPVTPPVRITARRPGFRRAGRAHPAEPTDHPAGTFAETELTVLEAEPMLVVERQTMPPSEATAAQEDTRGGGPASGAKPAGRAAAKSAAGKGG